VESSRAELLDRLFTAGRELSAAAVMFHAALAAHQGLSRSEEKSLDLLDRYGPLTARELSQRSGLAPASVTGLIDRLERKGLARRVRHPRDGRSVLVEPMDKRLADLGPLVADWVRSLHGLGEKYSDDELATIIDFLTQAAERQRAATEKLTSA
jgi:DNA-binding MarR family transcriptional regulator